MMKTKLRFTEEFVNQAKCPEGKDKIRYSDEKTTGLVLSVTAAGTKSYIYLRGLPKGNAASGKVIHVKIGRAGKDGLSLEQARNKAQEISRDIESKNVDPREKRKQEQLTYGELFRRYIEDYAQEHVKTWKDLEQSHELYFERFDGKPLSKIRTNDVQLWLKWIATEYTSTAVGREGRSGFKATATKNFNTMRAVWNWGLKQAITPIENPCNGVQTYTSKSRERFVLPGDEFTRFEAALNNEPNETIRDFFWMCLYTGARWGNVIAMEWNQINFGLGIWTIPETKNGDPHTVQLVDQAIEMLRRRRSADNYDDRWVFPSDRKGRITKVKGHLISPKNAWARLLKRAGIEDLTIHDLRRTIGSHMAIQGVSSTIISKALGQKSLQATAFYTRLTNDPVRAAMQAAISAEGKLEKLLAKPAEVIGIEAARKKKR